MKSLLCLTTLFSCALATGLSAAAQNIGEQRLTPDQIPWPASVANQAGSGMVQGLQTTYVVGDGASEGLYTLVFRLPANSQIAPHSHPDERSCFVLSGMWYFAYGEVRDEGALRMLPPGSNYTEPAGHAHYAESRETPVFIECTAVGPTGTTFVDPADDPRAAR